MLFLELFQKLTHMNHLELILILLKCVKFSSLIKN